MSPCSSSDFFTPTFSAIPPTPDGANFNPDIGDGADDARLLPDASWIAIVCGVTKEQWLALDEDEDSGLPDGFFVAPKDVYMPDLTAIGDVLLGKLVRPHIATKWNVWLTLLSRRVTAQYQSVLIPVRLLFMVRSKLTSLASRDI
jgi:hypothetical protein